jgi:hypothetical protein
MVDGTQGTRYSRVPAVIDALYAMFQQVVPAVQLQLPPASDGSAAEIGVFDGSPDRKGQLPDNYVCVGYAATGAAGAFMSSSGLSVESAYDISDIGNRQLFETFSVQCECSTFSGDTDAGAVSRQRARTGLLFSALAQSIQADPTLGGVLGGYGRQDYALLGGVRWLVDPSRDGASVTTQFAVRSVGEVWVPW